MAERGGAQGLLRAVKPPPAQTRWGSEDYGGAQCACGLMGAATGGEWLNSGEGGGISWPIRQLFGSHIFTNFKNVRLCHIYWGLILTHNQKLLRWAARGRSAFWG
jgi:hypothetical protein